MKIIRALALLTLIFTITPSISYAQQDTVVSVAFMTRDKNLWPDYRANKTSLDRLTTFLKRNPESKIYINVACASHATAAENLATARERLTAIKSQMAQRFSLEKFLHTSKISTVPVAGRTDIAVIVVKMPRPETPTASQTQTPTLAAKTPAPTTAPVKDSVTPETVKPEVVVASTKFAEPEPKQEVMIAAAVLTPAQKVEPTKPAQETKTAEPVVAAAVVEPAKKVEPATEKPAEPAMLAAKSTQPVPPTAIVTPTKEDEDQPIEFTADEIRTLINQADNFVQTPEFDIPISSGPSDLPQQQAKPDTYTNSKNLLPPVKYLNSTNTEAKKSRRSRK